MYWFSPIMPVSICVMAGAIIRRSVSPGAAAIIVSICSTMFAIAAVICSGSKTSPNGSVFGTAASEDSGSDCALTANTPNVVTNTKIATTNRE